MNPNSKEILNQSIPRPSFLEGFVSRSQWESMDDRTKEILSKMEEFPHGYVNEAVITPSSWQALSTSQKFEVLFRTNVIDRFEVNHAHHPGIDSERDSFNDNVEGSPITKEKVEIEYKDDPSVELSKAKDRIQEVESILDQEPVISQDDLEQIESESGAQANFHGNSLVGYTVSSAPVTNDSNDFTDANVWINLILNKIIHG